MLIAFYSFVLDDLVVNYGFLIFEGWLKRLAMVDKVYSLTKISFIMFDSCLTNSSCKTKSFYDYVVMEFFLSNFCFSYLRCPFSSKCHPIKKKSILLHKGPLVTSLLEN